ncbi:MAG: amino acid ABC transporter permease [Alphaproteobacteria bacterium]|nr:amino acid ABC transporter permease [Alphaproteobacteria bacterium]
MYEFALAGLLPYTGPLPRAIVLTLWLSTLSILLSVAVGVLGALCRTSTSLVLRWIGGAYVEVLRNIPLLVVIYLIFFGLAQVGLRVDGFNSALIALTLNAGAYMTEIFRGGLIAIPRGQYEAARSQGMTAFQLYRYVVFPQVFRIIYAPLGNLMIGIVIGSSLASVIGVEEVTTWMRRAGDETFRYMESFLAVGVIYVVLAQTINIGRIVTGRWLLSRAPIGHRR